MSSNFCYTFNKINCTFRSGYLVLLINWKHSLCVELVWSQQDSRELCDWAKVLSVQARAVHHLTGVVFCWNCCPVLMAKYTPSDRWPRPLYPTFTPAHCDSGRKDTQRMVPPTQDDSHTLLQICWMFLCQKDRMYFHQLTEMTVFFFNGKWHLY